MYVPVHWYDKNWNVAVILYAICSYELLYFTFFCNHILSYIKYCHFIICIWWKHFLLLLLCSFISILHYKYNSKYYFTSITFAPVLFKKKMSFRLFFSFLFYLFLKFDEENIVVYCIIMWRYTVTARKWVFMDAHQYHFI